MHLSHRKFALLLLISTCASLCFAKYSLNQETAFSRKLRSIPVEIGAIPPEANQESINLALVAYGIKALEKDPMPYYDPEVTDRGITQKVGLSDYKIVAIGLPGFESWSILGSTLAHEIEIHCRQNFILIALIDALGFDGTGIAEREAYDWELSQAVRFGLLHDERSSIKATVDNYYPRDFRVSNSPQIKSSLARFFIRSSLLSLPIEKSEPQD
jgi:hypothetical protein